MTEEGLRIIIDEVRRVNRDLVQMLFDHCRFGDGKLCKDCQELSDTLSDGVAK